MSEPPASMVLGSNLIGEIARQRVVPVIRAPEPEEACTVARACARGGMRVVELTRSTAEVELAVRELAREDIVVGVGTIADSRSIAPAVEAGARFVVSFANPPGFVAAAHSAGVTAIPGALTPDEIAAAVRDRADAIKVFPASSVSPSYLRSLRPVLPGTQIVVTGGIPATADGIRPWLEAGALAVGVGSLVGAGGNPDAVAERARALLAELRD